MCCQHDYSKRDIKLDEGACVSINCHVLPRSRDGEKLNLGWYAAPPSTLGEVGIPNWMTPATYHSNTTQFLLVNLVALKGHMKSALSWKPFHIYQDQIMDPALEFVSGTSLLSLS